MDKEYESCHQEMETVMIPHQPFKAFNRELDVDFEAEESNVAKVRRELKSLQERLTRYYCMGSEEREKHRQILLQNLNQLDLYWFEIDDFDKTMFRFRCAWTNHLVDETVEELYKAICENLKDLWSLEYEIGPAQDHPNPTCLTETRQRLNSPFIGFINMDVTSKIATNIGRDEIDSMSEFVMQALVLLRTELDKLESFTGKKREAHRRLLLRDLRVIQENLANEKAHPNALNLLIDHFNRKVAQSLQTAHQYCTDSKNELQKLLENTEYICEELMNRLILDNAMPGYEKALLGNELNNFHKDAKIHIEEVDNYHYELREMLKGITMKKIRGLTKDEYKQNIHSIIAFLEKAEVPLHVFKSVGFDLNKTEDISNQTAHEQKRTGVEEDDYESE